MRNIGGVALLASVLLTGCSAQVAAPAPTAAAPSTHWITKTGEPFDIASVKFQDSAIPDFSAAASKIPGYAKTGRADLAAIGHELCEHYAGGFNTEDLRSSGGDSLAAIGEAAKSTVCATR